MGGNLPRNIFCPVETMKSRNIPCPVVDRLGPELGKCLRGKKFPVGIFAPTDALAMEVMAYMQDRQVRIGRDILIVGYDDLYLTDHTNPPLTTIHQPFKELGKLSVEKIVNMIYGKKEKSERVLPFLVKRGTA
jgi:DNA-binding LacI/PurR family transcriptional regulator